MELPENRCHAHHVPVWICPTQLAEMELCGKEAREIIGDFISAFRAYEMDVETEPTSKHRAMMDRATLFAYPKE